MSMDEQSKTAVVGQSELSIQAHAINLKNDIRELLKFSNSPSGEKGDAAAKPIPFDVFKNLSNSVLALLDKVIDQPSMKDLAEAIERVNQTTKTIMIDVQAGKNVHSGPPTPAAAPVQTATTTVAEKDEFAGLTPLPPALVERMKTMPPESVEKMLAARRRAAAQIRISSQAAGGGAASTPVPVNVTASSVVPKAAASAQVVGGTTKIVLQSQNSDQGKAHDKVYKPLDKTKREIRVVKLFPDPDPDYDIRCELSVVSLGTRPVYKALSYTWGDPNDTVPITLNGHRFAVTRNLKKALQSLRSLDTDTSIWIDAICINQVDMDERKHQVEMMRVIFESPSEVVVWLGDNPTLPGDELWDESCFTWSGDESDVRRINSIMAFAEAYGDKFPEKTDPRSANPLMLGFCLMRLLAGDVHMKDIPLLRNINLRGQCVAAFQRLVMQPWWNRIWVVQEVLLPSTVTIVFGRFTAPLRMYADASINTERHKSSCCTGILPADSQTAAPIDDFCRKMFGIVESIALWRKKESISILTLLRLFYLRDATDARDKVYGLLGLVTEWGNSTPIAPDYTISPSELYQEVALKSISATGSLAILTFRSSQNFHRMRLELDKIKEGILYRATPVNAAEKYMQEKLHQKFKSAPDPVELEYSSWIANWETINEQGFRNPTSQRINRSFIFDASKGRTAPSAPIRYTDSPILAKTRVLTVSAVRVGYLDPKDPFNFMPIAINEFAAIKIDKFPLPLKSEDLPDQRYVTGGSEYDALWRTVCADSFFTKNRSAAGLDGRAMFRRANDDDLHAIQAWRRWMAHNKTVGVHKAPTLKEFSSPEEHEMVLKADRAIRSAGLQRRFFKTTNGYMGLAASGTTGGDEIYVLLGGRTPYVLRPIGNIGVEGLGERRLYAIVGEAYVHGIMDGELVNQGCEVQELLVI